MRNSEDDDYYAQRALEEIDRGDSAVDPTAAAVHYDLAQRYSTLAGRPDLALPKLTLFQGGKPYLAA